MAETVIRYDAPGEVLGIEEMPDGSIRATGTARRCGIYEYRRADGTIRRELVRPEDTFRADSLATLGGVALTACPPSGHPPEMLTPDNAAQYAAGHVHETIDAADADDPNDFGYVRIRFTARTRAAVEKLKAARRDGKPIYLSPGYALPEYREEPGVHPVWGAFDAIQGPPVYNHLALTDTPRGGDRMVVHMDGVDAAEQVRSDPAGVDEEIWKKAKKAAAEQGRPEDYAYIMGVYKRMTGRSDAQEGTSMDQQTTIRLDSGREVTIPSMAAQILRADMDEKAAAFEKMKRDMADMKAKMDKDAEEYAGMKAKMDEMAGEMKGEKALKEDAIKRADAAEAKLADVNALRQLLKPRVDLESAARQHLAADQHARIDSMGDDEIRRAVVATLLPGVPMEGVEGPELAGMYRAAISTRTARTDSKPPARDPRAPDPATAQQGTQARTDAEIHRAHLTSEAEQSKYAVRR